MLSLLQMLNLALSFLLELCALAAFGYWGLHMGGSTALRWLFGLGAPLLVAICWGIWAAPASTRRLTGLWYQLFKVLVFGGAVLALYASGQPTVALLLAVVVLINSFLLAYWKQ